MEKIYEYGKMTYCKPLFAFKILLCKGYGPRNKLCRRAHRSINNIKKMIMNKIWAYMLHSHIDTSGRKGYWSVKAFLSLHD